MRTVFWMLPFFLVSAIILPEKANGEVTRIAVDEPSTTTLAVTISNAYTLVTFDRPSVSQNWDFSLALADRRIPVSYGAYFSFPNIFDLRANPGYEAGVHGEYKKGFHRLTLFVGLRAILIKSIDLKIPTTDPSGISLTSILFDAQPSAILYAGIGYRFSKQVETTFSFTQGTIAGNFKTVVSGNTQAPITQHSSKLNQTQIMIGVTISSKPAHRKPPRKSRLFD